MPATIWNTQSKNKNQRGRKRPHSQRKVNNMTVKRLCELFNQYLTEKLNGKMPNAEDINDFAGKVASCYEEYIYIVQMLLDAIE